MATPFTTESPKEPGISRNVLLAAAGAVILLVLVLAATTLRHAPHDTGAPDAYAGRSAKFNPHPPALCGPGTSLRGATWAEWVA